MSRRLKHCQNQSCPTAGGKTSPGYLCTATCIERRCEACKHEEGCCKPVEDYR